MAYTVTVNVKIAESTSVIDPSTIAPELKLGNSYVDDAKFRKNCTDDQMYPENHFDHGHFAMVSSVQQFIDKISGHPSILSAFKEAYRVALAAEASDNVKIGKFEFTVDDYKEALYAKEVGAELADEGFSVTIAEKAA